MCGRPTPQAPKRRHFRPFEMKQLKCALQVGETMVTRQGCTCSPALHSFQPEDEVDLKTQKPAACNTNHSWEKQTPPGDANHHQPEAAGGHSMGTPHSREGAQSTHLWGNNLEQMDALDYLCEDLSDLKLSSENNKSVSPMSKWLIAGIVAMKAVRDFGRRKRIQHSPWNR